MRIRMVQFRQGWFADSPMEVGQEYDVTPDVGAYLIVVGAAVAVVEPVVRPAQAEITPGERHTEGQNTATAAPEAGETAPQETPAKRAAKPTRRRDK